MRDCTIRVAKTKALISFAITAKLICVFSLNNILFEFKNMSNTYIYKQDIKGSERKPMAYIVHFLICVFVFAYAKSRFFSRCGSNFIGNGMLSFLLIKRAKR